VLLLPWLNATGDEPMPETRPADFELTYTRDAGMRPRGGSLWIRGREACFLHRFDKDRGDRKVTLSDATLDTRGQRARGSGGWRVYPAQRRPRPCEGIVRIDRYARDDSDPIAPGGSGLLVDHHDHA
jgi:hypothetical protein